MAKYIRPEHYEKYRELAMAIVLQAVEDYKWYLKERAKGFRKREDYKGKNASEDFFFYKQKKEMGKDAEAFLKHQNANWFSGLPKNVDITEEIKRTMKGDNYANWKDIYSKLDAEHKNIFWKKLINRIEIDKERHVTIYWC